MTYLKIAHQTVLEPHGVTFLRPVWKFICEVYSYYLQGEENDSPVIKTESTESAELEIYYKTYINNFKMSSFTSSLDTVQAACDQGLTLGKHFLITILNI